MSPLGRRDSTRRAEVALLGSFAFLAIYFSGVFPPFSNPNELSRFQTVVAFVEAGTFSIDGPIRTLGDHEDKAAAGGRYYSNKAPGLALAAIPVYRALRIFLPAPRSGTSDAIFFWMRLLTVSLICLAALWRFLERLRASGASHSNTPWIASAVAFGTPYLFYARSFFSHAWTAALLFLAWDLLRKSEEFDERRRASFCAAGAGLLAGWAAISEYPAVCLALLLALRAGWRRSRRTLLPFALAAALPVALLLLYNFLCFGSPWVLSSAREAEPAFARLFRGGFFSLGPPSIKVAFSYLFHSARGVLVFSPFWIWAIFGFVRWWRSKQERADCLFAIAATLLFFILMTGYPNWHGGWSLGSRYLLPALFFSGLALGRLPQAPLSRGLFAVATVFSVANHLLLSLAWPHFPPDLPWPAATGSFWFLERDWIAPNLASRLGLGPVVALLLPVLLVLLVLALSLRLAAFSRLSASLAGLVGLAPFLLLLQLPPNPPFSARLWRAGVYGAFSGLDPERRELRREALSASTPSERRWAASAWRMFGPH